MGRSEEHAIHNGADDNASPGVAAVMELAAALDARPQGPEHGLVLPFGRRRGWLDRFVTLLGTPAVPLSNIIAYINFDMVGRLRENKLMVRGLGSAGEQQRLMEKLNIAAGLIWFLQDDLTCRRM